MAIIETQMVIFGEVFLPYILIDEKGQTFFNAYEQNLLIGNTLPNCFKVLGFTVMPTSLSDVKSKYKELVKVHHPDAGGSAEKFIEIEGAYREAQ
ncbi:J domain-containing protein [Desulfitobacterium hafniense]|uniref:J domain-containing protein n=1 Tax=Desulfitobacterium hafniense (strain Y51) TaxID=138119 RepID=Q24ZB4_DESHY|nr:J domain-containing protein [Desulfitobacterium hafniense]BAE82628.1 hypothetical protein DSY0839 [Desulfitobacterium hafniense Y51]